MNLTHIEKQQKRRELKLKGLSPQQVEIELSKIIKEKMEEEKVDVPEMPVESVADVPEVPEEERDQPEIDNPLPEEEDLSTVDTKD